MWFFSNWAQSNSTSFNWWLLGFHDVYWLYTNHFQTHDGMQNSHILRWCSGAEKLSVATMNGGWASDPKPDSFISLADFGYSLGKLSFHEPHCYMTAWFQRKSDFLLEKKCFCYILNCDPAPPQSCVEELAISISQMWLYLGKGFFLEAVVGFLDWALTPSGHVFLRGN